MKCYVVWFYSWKRSKTGKSKKQNQPNGYRHLWGDSEIFWEYIVEMVAELSDCAKYHWILHVYVFICSENFTTMVNFKMALKSLYWPVALEMTASCWENEKNVAMWAIFTILSIMKRLLFLSWLHLNCVQPLVLWISLQCIHMADDYRCENDQVLGKGLNKVK